MQRVTDGGGAVSKSMSMSMSMLSGPRTSARNRRTMHSSVQGTIAGVKLGGKIHRRYLQGRKRRSGNSTGSVSSTSFNLEGQNMTLHWFDTGRCGEGVGIVNMHPSHASLLHLCMHALVRTREPRGFTHMLA